MKLRINKWLVSYILIVFLAASGYVNEVKSATANSQPEKIVSNKEFDFVNYLKEILTDAGFSDAVKTYLVGIAQPHLAEISSTDLAYKERLFKRNLYIFLKTVAEKHQTTTTSSVITRQYFLAEQYEQPWDYILSKPVLTKFKDTHIFDKITINDIDDTAEKFCPVWPFCKEN